jgi:regulatory protein
MTRAMPMTITGIATVRVGSRVRVISLDGEPWRTTAAPVIRMLGIADGDIVESSRLAHDLEAAERVAARERALALLGYRERSVAELTRKLLDDGYPAGIAHDVVASLESSGLVDDARFAESFVRSRSVGKGLGRRRIERELAEKGISPEIAATVLLEYCDPEDAPERALQAARRLSRRGDRVDLLASRLVRKGYGVGEAFAAAREALLSATSGDDGGDGA